tara:strand:- start:51 stop:791 length:741 start_codon:yes stop_codon:yes gene_type:complete
MKIIALGTGESCDHHSNKLDKLDPSIKKIAFHRAFILLKERNIDVDYWTWTDPDAAESGLQWMVNNPNEKHPKIILPYWNRLKEEIEKYYRIADNLRGGRLEEHFRMLNVSSVSKNITYLDNALNFVKESTKIEGNRFNGKQVVFHTAGNTYGAENVFTRHLLPICHYLGAEEVYNLGLDNQGLGFNRGIYQWKNQQHEVNESLSHFIQWRKWDKEHNMKIYRCMEDRFTNIGDILPYKPLEDLYA